jgi:hypothetical protein
MRTVTIEIDERFGKEYAGKYVFQSLSWAKRSRIFHKHTTFHPRTGEVLKTDYVAIQAETVWASLKEQPPHKPITLEKLLCEDSDKGVPYQLGELFGKIVNELNGLTVDETAFLSTQLEGSSLTLRLQSSASAKSSDGPQTSLQDSQPKKSNSSSSSSTS